MKSLAALVPILLLPNVMNSVTAPGEVLEYDIAETSVIDDLSYLKDYENNAYRADFEFIHFEEYKYSAVSEGAYALYAYIYDAHNYLDRELTGISYGFDLTIGSTNYPFVEFQVTDKNDCYYKIRANQEFVHDVYSSSLVREYKFNGFKRREFVPQLEPGTRSPENLFRTKTLYSFNKKYSFSGSYSSEVDPLKCDFDGDVEVHIPLNADTYQLDDNFCQSKVIFYAYFGVPNYVEEYYGKLIKMHFEYDLLNLCNLFVLESDLDDSYPISIYPVKEPSNDYWPNEDKGILSNLKGFSTIGDIPKVQRFYVRKWNDKIPGNKVTERWENNPQLIKSIKYVDNTVTSDEGFDVHNKNGFESLFGDSALTQVMESLASWFFGFSGGDNEDITNLSFFEEFNITDINLDEAEFEHKFCIKSENVKKTQFFISDCEENDKSAFILRYAVGDYNSFPVYHRKWLINRGEVGYRVRTQAIRNFTVLDFTYERDGEETVITVIAPKVNSSPDLDAPDVDKSKWKVLFAVILIIALLVLLLYVLPKILHMVADISTIKKNRKAIKDIDERKK